jgi:hypothetical protein
MTGKANKKPMWVSSFAHGVLKMKATEKGVSMGAILDKMVSGSLKLVGSPDRQTARIDRLHSEVAASKAEIKRLKEEASTPELVLLDTEKRALVQFTAAAVAGRDISVLRRRAELWTAIGKLKE